jgi:hypothetical protein
MHADEFARHPGEAAAWRPQSPFDDPSPAIPVSALAPAASGGFGNESPFLNELEQGTGTDVLTRAELEFLSELHDPEFDEALYEVVHEVSSLAPHGVTSTTSEALAYETRVERELEERLSPLARVYENSLEELEGALAPLDAASLSEAELEAVIDRTKAPSTVLGPTFEFFVKKLWEKTKRAVNGAVKLAKKGVRAVAGVALKPVLRALGKLVRPLLKKVLALAMDKLPEKYRPLARKLAEKFGEQKKDASTRGEPAGQMADAAAGADAAAAPDAAAAGADAPQDPATADVAAVQSELDEALAEVVFASSEAEAEAELATREAREARPALDPVGELERGRARFARSLSALRDGEDPRPAVESFVPVVLGAVKLGVRVIGRKRVVSLLGGMLGKLITPLVGKGLGKPLGDAIADVGMRLLGFELSEAERAEQGSEVMARAVEETVRRVAAAPEYVLENETLLESYTLEAFEAAAAANFPPSMLRSELREAPGVDGMWVQVPPRGRSYYKKFSRTFEVEIARATAAATRTFEGRTLEAFLRDVARATFPVRARVHLFQIAPGGRLAHIAEHDKAHGLGHAAAHRALHPLTNQAALALLRHPRLGTPFPAAPDPLRAMVGQRFYFLEIEQASARPQGAASQLSAAVDFPRDEIRVRLHVGEPAAQSIASELRKSRRGAVLVHRLRLLFASATRELASAENAALLRILVDPPGAEGRGRLGAVTGRRPDREIRRELGTKLVEWTFVRLAEFARQRAEDFLRATEAPEPGVTLVLSFKNPARMPALRRALHGASPGPDDRWPPPETPAAAVRVFAGHRPDDAERS